MDYPTYITNVANLIDVAATIINPALAAPSSDPNFNNAIAESIFTTELRIQRDIDLLSTVRTDDTATLTASSRRFTFPTDVGTWVVVDQVALVIAGVRQPQLTPVTREVMSAIYPSDTPLGTPSIPLYWCPVDGASGLVGPAPDSNYPIEVVGTQRITPLSATNTSNWLTLYMPDLYMAASLQFWAGYQRDYGAQSDDPKMALSWGQSYEELMTPALKEEMRKKFLSIGAGAKQPSPVATPPQR